MGALSAAAQTGPYQFFAVAPCRIVDTRNPNSTNGGPIMSTNSQRDFIVRGNCGIPTTAKAVSLNVTITGATQSSFLTLWPSGGTRPVVSTINFAQTDPALANGAIVGVSTNAADLSVYNNFGNVHVILDVTGYFQ
jgi:serine protease